MWLRSYDVADVYWMLEFGQFGSMSDACTLAFSDYRSDQALPHACLCMLYPAVASVMAV